MNVAAQLGVVVREADLSLTDFYTADFVFSTGTMGELTPVTEIDGRTIEREKGEADFQRIYSAYKMAISQYCEMP
jgi:branched-chain amino acid aminotransferase